MKPEQSAGYHSHDNMAITDAIIFTGEAMVENHALLIDSHGMVKDIVPNRKIISSIVCHSLPDHIVAPGFIDIQVNGGDNRLFNATPSPVNAIAIAKAHLRHGTTRLLLTCITDTPETTRQAINATRAARTSCASILGIHLEGPHIAAPRSGVHAPSFIRPITPDDRAAYHPMGDEIILITLAPENVSSVDIHELRKQGNIIALGHTQANNSQIHEALGAGATGFTHLFNAMGGIEARNPGVAGIAIDDANSWCGIILDGHHVCPEVVRIALRAKHPDKMILVSDAMPPAATTAPQSFELYGKIIHVENNRCVDTNGRLAGSAITMADSLNIGISMGIDIETLLRAGSANPAAFLGIAQKFGKLIPGYVANFIALDLSFKVKKTWQNGHVI